jgi:hypothetical protein
MSSPAKLPVSAKQLLLKKRLTKDMKMIGNNFWRGPIFKRWHELLVIGAVVTALGACGPGLDSLTPYAVGGTMTGLTGTVVLQNSGGDNLSLTANGSFSFKTKLVSDASYVVTVLTQPSGQICTVSGGSGTATANITTVAVDCIVLWTGAKQLGAVGAATFGRSVATDTSGDVFVAGITNSGLDGNTKTGITDFFVTKYNGKGEKQYTKQLGVAGADTNGLSVVTDASDNVYVAGYTTGRLDGNPLMGQTDFFVTKYDNSGAKLYTQQLGVAGAKTYGYSVATDTIGNVYVAGKTSGGLDGNTLMGTSGFFDFFVTKFDSSGVKLYTKQLGVAGAHTHGLSVATDGSGNVYVAGDTSGSLDDNTLTGTTDFFVTKYDSSGVKLFTKQLGVAGAVTHGLSIATDGSGNVYVAGDTSGGLDGNALTGTTDFFVTKYDSSGVKLFTKQLGVAGANTHGLSVVTTVSGYVYVAGDTSGGLDLNKKLGTTDFFVTKYNSSLEKIFTRQLGVTGADTHGLSVATDGSGNVYVGGDTSGGLDGNTLTGATDFFVSKYDSDGVKK